MAWLPISILMHFAAACQNSYFLGLKPWYYYLPDSAFNPSTCDIISFTFLSPGHPSDILLILLALVDDLLIVAGLLAVIFVIAAGFKYVTSQGSPDGAAKALSTLINALIGLAMAVIAVQFVAFLGYALAHDAQHGSAVTRSGIDLSPLPATLGVDNGNIIQTVLSIVFGVLGALSLMLIVIGGFRYTGSRGDPQGTAAAKRTIIYALIGLVIAVLAQSIVSAVAGRL